MRHLHGKQLALEWEFTIGRPGKAPEEGWQGVIMEEWLLLRLFLLPCQLWVGWACAA